MYLSRLIVDVGDDPNRLRPGRDWLKNVYRVHQRLCMAFPENRKLESTGDPFFLQPWSEQMPLEERRSRICHVERGPENGFLFRIENTPSIIRGKREPSRTGKQTMPHILVQSFEQPNWEYAFQNAEYLLRRPPEIVPSEKLRAFIDEIIKDGRAQFRLRANPTVKRRVDRKDNSLTGKNGKRHVLVDKNEQLDWLRKRTVSRPDQNGNAVGGFDIGCCEATPEGSVIGWKGSEEEKEKRRLSFRSVLFEGTLTVTDPVAFKNTLAAGIGSGKAFGFGLLSVARI